MTVPSVVFLAEDNPADIALLRLALKQHCVDCMLLVHRDGASALAAIINAERAGSSERPALFMFDLNLAKVNGISLLKRLKESSVFGNTPVIIWTTSDSASDRERSSECGASRHIRKPAQLDEFLKLGAMIGKMLEAA